MIKFKQKGYPNLGVKVLKKSLKKKTAKNTSIMNAVKTQGNSGLMNGAPQHKDLTGVASKSNYQETVDSIAPKKGKLEKALTTPINELSNSFLKSAAENPLMGISTVSPIPGSTLVAAPLENKVFKRFIPGYKKVTENLGNRYKNSALSKKIRSLKSPSILDIAGKNVSNPYLV